MDKPNIDYIDKLVDATAEYLYALAGRAVGHIQDIYMDAADALMDVMALWHEKDDAA